MLARPGNGNVACRIFEGLLVALALDRLSPSRKLPASRYCQRRLQTETSSHEWLWITTLDSQSFSAVPVRRFGHDRRVRHDKQGCLTLENLSLAAGTAS